MSARGPLSFQPMRSHYWLTLASDWPLLGLCTSVPQSCPVIGPGAHCLFAIAFKSLCLVWIFAIATGGSPLGKVVLVTLDIWYYMLKFIFMLTQCLWFSKLLKDFTAFEILESWILLRCLQGHKLWDNWNISYYYSNCLSWNSYSCWLNVCSSQNFSMFLGLQKTRELDIIENFGGL